MGHRKYVVYKEEPKTKAMSTIEALIVCLHWFEERWQDANSLVSHHLEDLVEGLYGISIFYYLFLFIFILFYFVILYWRGGLFAKFTGAMVYKGI